MPRLQQLTLGQLRLLPDDDRVEWLRAAPEGQWLERKGPRIRARALADLLVGFANAEGGLICIGVQGGAVEGVDQADKLLNEWRQAAVDFTVPPVRHAFEIIACTNRRGEPDHLAVIEVEASERVHESASGDTFLRIGDENRKLGPFMAQELRYDKGESTFDGRAQPGATMADLDDERVGRYLAVIHGIDRPDSALRARGMLIDQKGADVPTVAGLLVLGRDPGNHFPEAYVRLLRYRGSARETGARSNVVQDVRLSGPIPAQNRRRSPAAAPLAPERDPARAWWPVRQGDVRAGASVARSHRQCHHPPFVRGRRRPHPG